MKGIYEMSRSCCLTTIYNISDIPIFYVNKTIKNLSYMTYLCFITAFIYNFFFVNDFKNYNLLFFHIKHIIKKCWKSEQVVNKILFIGFVANLLSYKRKTLSRPR